MKSIRTFPIPVGSLLSCLSTAGWGRVALIPVVFIALVAPSLAAEARYFRFPMSELQWGPENEEIRIVFPSRGSRFGVRPAVTFWADGAEAYIEPGENAFGVPTHGPRLELATLWVKTPATSESDAKSPLLGRLFVTTTHDGKQAVLPLDVRIPGELADAKHRAGFLVAKMKHYHDLAEREIAGGAWFRHQESEAARAAGVPLTNRDENDRGLWGPRPDRWNRSYELLTGGRALSENLQLDRVIEAARSGAREVDVDTIEGIEVRPMDWKPLLKGLDVEVHPLAPAIPHDQHVVFFNTFGKLVEWVDESRAYGSIFTGFTDVESGNSHVLERYQTQLILPLDDFARQMGGQLIGSVAATGSDPYLRTGSDLAMIFESTSPDLLHAALETRMRAVAGQHDDVSLQNGTQRGTTFVAAVSSDRRVSSYLAHLSSRIVVTNSLAQLDRLIAVDLSETKSLDKTPEYAFFAARYRRTPDQDALLIISDETIRRWCSPIWRIGASRRIRAAAYLSEVQARYSEEILSGVASVRPIPDGADYTELGRLRLSPHGVQSERFGSLAFLTPISELDVKKVTKSEADGYRLFRDRYQSRWRVFDPIALELGADKKGLRFDLAVLPLILGSDYNDLVDVTGGAKFGAAEGDRHAGTLLHLMWSLSPDSELRRLARGILPTQSSRIDPLGWLGDYVELYIDADQEWLQNLEVDRYGFPEEKSLFRTPVVLAFDVKNSFLLSGFLASLRTLSDSTAPGLTSWEPLEHNGESYVRVRPSGRAAERNPAMQEFAIYYAPTADKLAFSLREDVMKRFLDRTRERFEAPRGEPGGSETPRPGRKRVEDQPEWLGDNVAVRLDQRFLSTASEMFGDSYQRQLERRCFANLPILNEWKQRFPDRDPVEVHHQLWHVRLQCPAGGDYVWNESARTMESTRLGHPGSSKRSRALSELLSAFREVQLGLTFEHDGIRVRGQLERAKK